MWNESAQNLVDIRISSWILSSIYPMCSSFSLARTTTRTLRMVIKGDGRRLFCFCKSTRSFARFKAFCALFFSREKERMREKNNVTHRTVQLHKNTKLPKRSFAHMLSLSTDDTHRCTALCFSPSSSIASFLTRKKRKSMMPSSRSNDDARHKVSCSLSVSDRVYYCFTCAKIREIFEKIERRFSFERKGTNFIPQKLEKSIHFESFVSSFKLQMAFGGGGGFGSAQNVPQSPFGQAPASPFGGGGGGVASSGSGGFGAPSNQQGSVGGLFSQPSSGVVGGFGQQQQQQTGNGQLGGFGQPQQQAGGVSPGTSTFCKLRVSCVLIFNFPFDFVSSSTSSCSLFRE